MSEYPGEFRWAVDLVRHRISLRLRIRRARLLGHVVTVDELTEELKLEDAAERAQFRRAQARWGVQTG